MTPYEIEIELGQWLDSALNGKYDISFPNEDDDPSRPFIDFQHIPVSTNDPSISGGDEINRGSVILTVVTKRDKFATSALQIAGELKNIFPYTTRILTENGLIIINKPPELQQAFRDGSDWRQPVKIDYQTEE